MLSVIIPTCNRNELLSKCLDKLRPGVQSISPVMYEVIVTDDSKNNLAQHLIQKEFKWAKWIEGPKKGPAANRNNGAKYAKGDWLIFIDDDCMPDKNLLKEYINGITNNSNCLAFEGAIFPDDEKLLKKDMAECPVNTVGGCFWSANICINARLFKEIGGFDKSFLIAAQEDQDIYIRIKLKTAVPFLKKSIVIHPVRLVLFMKKFNNIKKECRNYALFFRKHKTRKYINIVKHSIWLNLKNTILNLLKCRFKSACLNLLAIMLGIPIFTFYYLRQND